MRPRKVDSSGVAALAVIITSQAAAQLGVKLPNLAVGVASPILRVWAAKI